MVVPVVITVFADRSFSFVTKTPPVAGLLLKAAGLKKGSGEPNRNKVGTVTADQVAEIAGSPGTGGVTRDEAWFYTQYRVRNFTYNAPQVIERDIVAISFSEAGNVTNIERFGLEDGQIVQLSRRVTESSVRDVGFLSQILSNFGRINLGDIAG